MQNGEENCQRHASHIVGFAKAELAKNSLAQATAPQRYIRKYGKNTGVKLTPIQNLSIDM